jgi:hypothetical protein
MKLGTFTVLFVCMIMFLEFVGIPTGASLMLGTFGIDINHNTGELISADGEQSTFWGWIFGAGAGILVILSLGGAVIVGLFSKSFDTSLIILPLVISLGTTLSSTAWTIIKYMNTFGSSWATNIVAIIMAGLGVAFIMSCVDYFAGR